MSSNKDNLIFKKTSFLSGVNSSYIEDYYATYLEDPRLLPYDWQKFFEGLNEDKSNISKDIMGPSWSPKKDNIKIINKNNLVQKKEVVDNQENAVHQTTKDSVRAIMLIRAYRIRGHLIANLDPLKLQKKK